jgi:hypothetical protein
MELASPVARRGSFFASGLSVQVVKRCAEHEKAPRIIRGRSQGEDARLERYVVVFGFDIKKLNSMPRKYPKMES